MDPQDLVHAALVSAMNDVHHGQDVNLPNETPGMITPGNITDLYTRPVLHNPDGTISTTRSMSFNENGKEILVPTVVNGKLLTNQQAIDEYHRTGKHLGMFSTPEAADQYAAKLHDDQARFYK